MTDPSAPGAPAGNAEVPGGRDSVDARRTGNAGGDLSIAQLVHDLRNPLNTISMNVELVSIVADEGEISAEVGESLAALERAVGELERGLATLEAHVAGASRTVVRD